MQSVWIVVSLSLLLPLTCLCKVPALIDTARHYTYVREIYHNGKPINRSPEIDVWALNVGIAIPKNPFQEGPYWCMIYVYNMVDKTFKAEGRPNPLMKTARVATQLRYAKKIGSGLQVISMKKIGAYKLIKPADIFCMKEGKSVEADIGKDWSGHTGLIEYMQSMRVTATCEGNTNKAGSSNGDRVRERTRDYITLLAVIRLPFIH